MSGLSRTSSQSKKKNKSKAHINTSNGILVDPTSELSQPGPWSPLPAPPFMTLVTDGLGGWAIVKPITITYTMNIIGDIETADLRSCSQIASSDGTLSEFFGRRRIPGTAGTTKLQLMVNGSAISGVVLTWTRHDQDFAYKRTRFTLNVKKGDLIELKLLDAETDASDIYMKLQ